MVLGTASQAPTRRRNQNGYLLKWEGRSVLFDPGEGTQRQMLLAGTSAWPIQHICITHFHGDHCLGLPGVLQRMSLDGVPHPVHVLFPASGADYFERLRHASVFADRIDVRPVPVAGDGPVFDDGALSIGAVRLDHEPETFGWWVAEPPGRRMLPARLAALGIRGEAIGRLQRLGSLEADGRRVGVEEVSEHRPGQRMAFVMDTGISDAAVALAADADLVVCEATFSSADVELARRYRHLTAADAARVARDAGARLLVLTHFSQRYADTRILLDEASAIFSPVIAAEDLGRVPLPPAAPRSDRWRPMVGRCDRGPAGPPARRHRPRFRPRTASMARSAATWLANLASRAMRANPGRRSGWRAMKATAALASGVPSGRLSPNTASSVVPSVARSLMAR